MQIITFVHLYERSTDISTVFALHSAAWHFASRPFECRPEIRKPHAVRTTTCRSAQFRPEDGRRHTSGFVSPKITVTVWIHSGDIIRNHRSADNGFRDLCTGTPNPKTPANPQQVAFRRLCCRSFTAGIGRSESGRWQPPIGKSKPGFGITALRSASGKTGSTTLPHK